MDEVKEIVKFDPTKLADHLKDKIRLDIAELMPEEMWQGLLKNEIEKFITEQPAGNGYSNRTTSSDLSKLTKEILKKELEKKIGEYFAGEEWAGKWESRGTGGPQALLGKAVKEIIVDNADIMFENMIAGAVSSVLRQLKDTASNNY